MFNLVKKLKELFSKASSPSIGTVHISSAPPSPPEPTARPTLTQVPAEPRSTPSPHPKETRISPKGLKLIKEFEGFRPYAYPDPASPLALARKAQKETAGLSGNPWTIGYGHTGLEVVDGLKVTEEEATQLLAVDVGNAEKAVCALHWDLTQNQFDALTSFTYNCGASNLKRLAAHGVEGVAERILLYDKARGIALPGLTRRRIAESSLFKS